MKPMRARAVKTVAGAAGAALLVLAAIWLVSALASCSSTATNVQVRTFERAQRMDVVCMRVLDDSGNPIVPQPAVQAQCAPVPTNVTASTLPYHLYAVVTQSIRGEVAVVDLTGGAVVDVSATTPGINFLPVGELPTDVAATPDGKMVFVASAELDKPAIYGIPSVSLLGDVQHLPIAQYAEAGVDAAITDTAITRWPVCQLPQKPGRITVIPRGVSDAGASAGYDLVVVLPGSDGDGAKVVTIDASQFLSGSIAPGSLAPCPIEGAIPLADTTPSSWSAGPAWPDGLVYVDGGVDLFATGHMPKQAGSCDAGVDASADASGFSLLRAPGTHARATSLASAGDYLYVGDDQLPIIHVIDATDATALREIAPLVASSALDPSRVVTTKDLAVSPTTRDYRRYLYALDHDEGSIIIYDITDPKASPRTPLEKPHAELNPFQPPDRILFNVPVAALSFVKHDYPLLTTGSSAAGSGILCTPNPNAPMDDLGTGYRAGSTSVTTGIGPARLRGVFGMVTLSNGQIVTIDVDDWDAPCRRPSQLSDAGASTTVPANETLQAGDLAISQDDGTGPYQAPHAFAAGIDYTSSEAFFPVSQPNRTRSTYYLRNDPSLGKHIPYVLGTPQLFEGNALVGESAKDAVLTPATAGTLNDPNAQGATGVTSGVRMAFEDPQVHIDQDWQVTFEGALPGTKGVVATLSTTDAYQTLTFKLPQSGLCRLGVEDARVAGARLAQALAEDATRVDPSTASRVGDYVQLTDDMVPNTDPYWTLDNACWEGDLKNDPTKRATVCQEYFGNAADQSTTRDFPILEAYDDRLVVGGYSYKAPMTPAPGGHYRANANASAMRLAQCCFHNQTHFAVRTGAEWVATGSVTGYLSHLAVDAATGACVPSCVRREALLSARMFEVGGAAGVDRNSSLALRNPFFSAWMKVATAPDPKADPVYTFTVRDAVWKFSTRGGFVPQTINLATTTTAVVPQSMRFIESLGQLAVVDGSSQGLVLIDLNALALAHNPYF